MGTVTGADTYFTNIDGGFTQTKWETLILQAANKINGYAKQQVIPNPSGAEGSYSWVLSSQQEGFVRSLTSRLYNVEYKLPGSTGLGNLSENVADLTVEVERLARAAAAALTENDWSRAFI